MRPKLAGLRRRDPRRASAPRTSSTGGSPHSLLLELFTDAGHRHQDRGRAMTPGRAAGARAHERDRLLRALPGRVRPRRGRAPVGRRGQRVPRLPVRHLGDERRPLPPARRRGRPRAGRAPDAHGQPLLHRAGDAPGRAPVASRASAARSTSATPAPRPTRPRSSSRARPRRGGDVVVVHGAFHGRTYGALSATPQESKQAPFAPLVPGFRAVVPTPEALAAAVDERHRRGAARADPGRDRRQRALRGAACRRRARPATSTARR